MSIQRRIKKVLAEPESEAREDALRDLARDMGCSLSSLRHSEKLAGFQFTSFSEDELVRRIQEADRSKRESRMWWIALCSAIASVISAFASWAAATGLFVK